MRAGYRSLAVCLLALIVGCGSRSADSSKARLEKLAGGPLKEVVPASGKVLVDGSPQTGVNIFLYAMTGEKPITEVTTGVEGKYCWTSYIKCDGLIPGEYRLTFTHTAKKRRNSGKAEDLLKGRYSDPAKSEYKLTVEKGKPQSDVNYELTTK